MAKGGRDLPITFDLEECSLVDQKKFGSLREVRKREEEERTKR